VPYSHTTQFSCAMYNLAMRMPAETHGALILATRNPCCGKDFGLDRMLTFLTELRPSDAFARVPRPKCDHPR
jgi:hypothetical protein